MNCCIVASRNIEGIVHGCAIDEEGSLVTGDNVFDYLIEGAKVTAVDFNGAQIALTEIKKVACMKLSHEDFFKIFAKNDVDLLRAHYHATLRQLLTRPSAAFWDKQMPKCAPSFSTPPSFFCLASACDAGAAQRS